MDGRIVPVELGVVRKPPKRVDYFLRFRRDLPLAVVEAKAGYKAAADGLQKAKQYPEMLDLKFACATNGHDARRALLSRLIVCRCLSWRKSNWHS